MRFPPTTVLTARYGTNRFPNLIAEVSDDFDPATLGFHTLSSRSSRPSSFPPSFSIAPASNSARTPSLATTGPHFLYSDMYITKTFLIRERIKLRIDTQLFNAFNHPNFALPVTVQAGAPGAPITNFGTLQSTTQPPTGLLGVGLGGDTSPRMIAFQGRIEF